MAYLVGLFFRLLAWNFVFNGADSGWRTASQIFMGFMFSCCLFTGAWVEVLINVFMVAACLIYGNLKEVVKEEA